MQAERLGSGVQVWPLLSGTTNAPVPTAGNQTVFFLKTVPDRCPSPGLAYLLPMIAVTIALTWTQGGAGSVVPVDRLLGCILDSVEVSGAWHGTPVKADSMKGIHAQVWEFVGNGFRYATRRQAAIPVAAAAYRRDITFLIPLCSRQGGLLNETSQLALLYQNAQLKLNFANLTTSVTNASAGSTVALINVQASGVLVPTSELLLGTPTEFILHTFPSGGSQIEIPNFGLETGLTGVLGKSGVLHAAWLTNVLDQGGSFASANVTQYDFAWRGQTQTNHSIAVALAQHWAMINDRTNLGVSDTSVAPHQEDLPAFPYLQTASDAAAVGLDQNNMYFWPLVPGSNTLQLTDLQTANGNQKFNATVTGGFGGTPHSILCHYAKVWDVAKRKDFIAQIGAGGTNSLAYYVLGAQAAASTLVLRKPKSTQTWTPDQATYLPAHFCPPGANDISALG
jgi:hypothetical protein